MKLVLQTKSFLSLTTAGAASGARNRSNLRWRRPWLGARLQRPQAADHERHAGPLLCGLRPAVADELAVGFQAAEGAGVRPGQRIAWRELQPLAAHHLGANLRRTRAAAFRHSRTGACRRLQDSRLTGMQAWSGLLWLRCCAHPPTLGRRMRTWNADRPLPAQGSLHVISSHSTTPIENLHHSGAAGLQHGRGSPPHDATSCKASPPPPARSHVTGGACMPAAQQLGGQPDGVAGSSPCRMVLGQAARVRRKGAFAQAGLAFQRAGWRNIMMRSPAPARRAHWLLHSAGPT